MNKSIFLDIVNNYMNIDFFKYFPKDTIFSNEASFFNKSLHESLMKCDKKKQFASFNRNDLGKYLNKIHNDYSEIRDYMNDKFWSDIISRLNDKQFAQVYACIDPDLRGSMEELARKVKSHPYNK